MGLLKLLGTSFNTILNGGNPTADRTITFPDVSGEALLVGRALTLMTNQNSTSGTSIDFTGIPSWANRITVMFNGVSTNGGSNTQIQIGSGAIETTGYSSTSSAVSTAAAVTSSNTGMVIYDNGAADIVSGHMVLTKLDGNTWVSSHSVKGGVGYSSFGGGDKTLSAVLDRIRVTTVNGTDTFDAGSINIMYEG